MLSRDRAIGRAEDLAAVDDFLRAVPMGASALILSGEAGIGKTMLWTATIARVKGAPGTCALATRAIEAESDLAYVTLTDLIGPLFETYGPSLPTTLADALAVAILRRHGEPVDPRTIGTAMSAILRLASTHGPVLLFIDDVQWIDAASSAAIGFALRRLLDAPIAAILTMRSPAAGNVASLVPVLRNSVRCVDLPLGPISLGALHHVIKERVGTAATRPQLTALAAASRGNPLFAIEIARELLRLGRWPLPGEPMPIPPSAAALIGERFARLPRADREALFAAAAMSSPTMSSIAAVTAGQEAAMALERASADGLISIDITGQILFEHPLMAAAALEAIPAGARRIIHGRLADAAASVEDRGRHVALAAAGPSARAASALDAAAVAARGRGATSIAAEWAERSAALTPRTSADHWAARITRAARWFSDIGEVERARELLGASIPEMKPGDGRAAAMLVMAQISSWTEGSTAALDWIERGLSEATGADIRPRLLLRRAFEVDALGIPAAITAAAAAVAELEAADLGGRPPDADLLACALLQLAALRLSAGLGVDADLTDRARSLLSPQPRRTPDGDESPESLRAHAMVWEHLVDMDDLAAARELQLAAFERDLARGHDRALPIVAGDLAMTELWMGRWEEASVHADQALEFAERAGANNQGMSAALSARAFCDVHIGDLAAAEEGASRGLALSTGPGDWYRARHTTVLAMVAWSRGDPGTACRMFGQVYDELMSAGDREMLLHRFVGDLVETAIATGDVVRALQVVGALDESVAAVPRPWVLTMAARGHALIAAAEGDLTAAAAAADVALKHASILPMPFEQARTSLISARIARRRKQRRLAGELLERARSTFATLGAVRWVATVDAELARTGLRSKGGDDLTETEDQVARLAARGMTNREVGKAAFLTEKSVEGVLARVYGKLAIQSRAELGAWLASEHRGRPDPD